MSSKEQKENVLSIRLSGSVEESVNFKELIGEISAQELHVNCKGIPRINSIGVKAWIQYFQEVAESGIKLTFVECSTAIVEQVNLISNFACGGEVESIFVPFSCGECNAELVGLFKSADLKKINFNIPELKCTKCGGQAVFDDIPEEYFNFLMD